MQDYPNTVAAESGASPVSRSREIAQFHPTVPEVPLQECLWRKARTQARCGGQSTFIEERLSDGPGSPERDCVTRGPEMRLVLLPFLPLSFLSFECSQNKRGFFFQIALGGKFLNGVIENVRQYSLPELLTFWIVVTLWFFSKHMDQAWLHYWTGSLDERPAFIFLCIFPFCLLVAFSRNIIVVFLSCPGSRYCLTKYFMVQSTPYLPTASYLLSKNKGFIL